MRVIPVTSYHILVEDIFVTLVYIVEPCMNPDSNNIVLLVTCAIFYFYNNKRCIYLNFKDEVGYFLSLRNYKYIYIYIRNTSSSSIGVLQKTNVIYHFKCP